MGFCHRCGDITVGKCSKCGGRSVASTISNIVSEGGMSIVDRWQSQYADTILAPEELVQKQQAISSATKIVSVTQSNFYKPPIVQKKVCCCCSKPLSTSYVEDNLSYCKECHLRLHNKGECPTCQKPVSKNDAWIEHAASIWHAHCFTCFSCQLPLEANPLIDLKQRPCCEPCFNAQSGKSRRIPATPSPSKSSRYDSYSSQSSSGSSSTSELYLNSARNSRRPRIDRDLFAVVTPPRTPSPATDEDIINTTTTTTRVVTPNPRVSPSSISRQPCHHCHLPLGDSSQKKTKIPMGDGLYAWFHKSCFLCSKCQLPFQNGECATDGHTFYHAQCEVTGPNCFGCKKSVSKDAFQFNDKMYHFECFRCFGNGCKIGLGQPVYEVGRRPYCENCHRLTTTTTTTTTTAAATTTIGCQEMEVRPTIEVKRRPKLGGAKTCPRCRHSISIMDDTPGPLASRWHKKCLACTTCHKQLDSAAKTKQGAQGESLVFCQKCL